MAERSKKSLSARASGKAEAGGKARPAKSDGIEVCLLGQHPMALEQWRALLGGREFRLRVQAFTAAQAVQPGKAGIPAAQVYVVDAQGPRAVVESLAGWLQAERRESKMLVVGPKMSNSAAFGLLRQGARGVLTYEEAVRQLKHAVPAVAAGGYWVPRQVLSEFVDSILHAGSRAGGTLSSARMSRREREVCDALLENLSNKEIASRLNISERTVKFHVSNLLAKFGVQRRADLILLCYQGERN